MKKLILFLSVVFMLASVAGCSKDDKGALEENTGISSDIKEIVEDEAVNEVVVGDVQQGELADKIQKINKDAVVQQSINPGMKMLKVELPIAEDKLPDSFFKQIVSVVNNCKLKDNADFDYFYFSTSKDDKVQIAASFKRVDEEFTFDAVTGVAPEYKDAAERAAKVSSLFKKSE